MATGDSTTDRLDAEILDSMAELLAAMITRAEEVAQRYGVPIFFLKALHRLDCPLAMKDLGLRMRCDPSFVTSVADQLEKRGLATRESDPADRRGQRGAPPPAAPGTKDGGQDQHPKRPPPAPPPHQQLTP